MKREQAEKRALELYPEESEIEFTNHIQEEVGAGYPLSDILNNLEPDQVADSACSFARSAYMRCYDDMNQLPKLKYLNVPVKGINSDQSL